ncbi:MAG: hypothetical protein LBJ13_04025 [Puniceicoccales bacterium]|jgi:hypothetical protein|nr:hypothetical protein [Puniceicoccales bacterium]
MVQWLVVQEKRKSGRIPPSVPAQSPAPVIQPGTRIGLPNPGRICYVNAAMQTLSLAKKFVEALMLSTNENPFVVALQEILRNLYLGRSIQKDRYMELLGNHIFPALNSAGYGPFNLNEGGNTYQFLEGCLRMLEKLKEPAAQFFQCTLRSTLLENSGFMYRVTDVPMFVLNLPRKLESGEKKISREFYRVMQSFSPPKEPSILKRRAGVGGTIHRHIVKCPQYLLVHTYLVRPDLEKNARPMDIPWSTKVNSGSFANPEWCKYGFACAVLRWDGDIEKHVSFIYGDSNGYHEISDDESRDGNEPWALGHLRYEACIVLYERKD